MSQKKDDVQSFKKLRKSSFATIPTNDSFEGMSDSVLTTSSDSSYNTRSQTSKQEGKLDCVEDIPSTSYQILTDEDDFDNESLLDEDDFIVRGIHKRNRFHVQCQHLLKLSEVGQSLDFVTKMQEKGSFAKVLAQMKYSSHSNKAVLFCEALCLYIFTKHRLFKSEYETIEQLLCQYIKATIPPSSQSTDSPCESQNIELYRLPSHVQESALKCMDTLPHTEVFNNSETNVFFLCCASLHNICSQSSELENVKLSQATICVLIDKFFELSRAFELYSADHFLDSISDSDCLLLVTIQLSLEVFEQVLQSYYSEQKNLLHYKEHLFLRCLNKVLACCIKLLFPKNSHDSKDLENLNFIRIPSAMTKCFYLYQSCLFAVLKALLRINLEHASKSDFYLSLMQKLMLCFIETNISDIHNKFDLCFMTLELMINFNEFKLVSNSQFTKLCLMKFHVGKSFGAVELLIKILECSLMQVLNLWEQNNQQMQNNTASGDSGFSVGIVFHTATEHMEQSFVSSYISVLLSQFCSSNEKFLKHVSERLHAEHAMAAVVSMEEFEKLIPIMEEKHNSRASLLLDCALQMFKRIYNEKAHITHNF